MESDEQRVAALAERIVERLGAGPASFYDLLGHFANAEYRDLLRAWGQVRERIALERDEHGNYLLPGSPAAAADGHPGSGGDGR